jgi:ATP-dependent Clp protease ATP-binding subunit ClpA
MFKPITKELSSRIFNLKLSKISQRYMEKLRTEILFSDNALDFMCEHSFDRKNGVRFIERNIESYLDDLILNSNKLGCFENNSINVKLKNDKLYLEVTSNEKQSKRKHCKESN